MNFLSKFIITLLKDKKVWLLGITTLFLPSVEKVPDWVEIVSGLAAMWVVIIAWLGTSA